MENENSLNNQKRALPNATGSLVLGIISIVLCWCYGIIGFITGVIGMILAIKDSKSYKQSPDSFTVSSINNYKAGLICSIIGTALSLLFLVIFIVLFNKAGWDINIFIQNLKDFQKK